MRGSDKIRLFSFGFLGFGRAWRKLARILLLLCYKERGTNNLVILVQPFFHQTTLFFCEEWGYLKKNRGRMMEQRAA